MQIKVLFFGQLKDICGHAEARLELPEGATVKHVFDHYATLYPRLAGLAGSTVLARNQEFAPGSEPLADGDDVALLPPVSGGAPVHELVDPEGHWFLLTHDPIDPRHAEQRLLQGSDGALVTFHGVVRNNTQGRTTLRLDYTCYEAMAIRKMAELGRAVVSEFSVSRIAILHRLGLLEIGEASVLIIVTSPHRRAAFEAALATIDRLKKVVPIWKKEFFADGEIWVEGDWDENAPRAGS